MGQAICRDFLNLLKGSLNIEDMATHEKPKEIMDVLEDDRLTLDQKLQLMVKKFITLGEEKDGLKSKLAEAERRLAGLDAKIVDVPLDNIPTPTQEIKSIIEDKISIDQKLLLVCKCYVNLMESKQALAVKLAESEKKLQEVKSLCLSRSNG